MKKKKKKRERNWREENLGDFCQNTPSGRTMDPSQTRSTETRGEKETIDNLIMLQVQLLHQYTSTLRHKTVENKPEFLITTLYEGGWCKWTGCAARCGDLTSFLRHVTTDHVLDERSTTQVRIQIQILSQLELQLMKEKERLQTMTGHLGISMPKSFDWSSQAAAAAVALPLDRRLNEDDLTPSEHQSNNNNRYVDCPAKTLNDTEKDYLETREFYKANEVRPPFTYASLIRQAIVDSKDRQLSLNEIYNWFQTNFAYFRKNAATWKNAIRTNLSLHKCFVRFEDEFGSFWTVDDDEFLKRRHLTRGRPRKYQPSNLLHATSSHAPSPAATSSQEADFPTLAFNTKAAGLG